MSRILSHQWANKKPFTQRVRWYAATREWNAALVKYTYTDVRLQFEDENGKQSKVYGDDDVKASADWNAFRDGTLTTEMIRKGESK